MSNFGINFVNACNAGLSFRIQTADGEIERRADDTADGVYLVERYGIASDCYFSSDMDLHLMKVSLMTMELKSFLTVS